MSVYVCVHLCAFMSVSVNLLIYQVCNYACLHMYLGVVFATVYVYVHIFVCHICNVACTHVLYGLCTCRIHVQSQVWIWVRCLCASGCVCISACMPMHVYHLCNYLMKLGACVCSCSMGDDRQLGETLSPFYLRLTGVTFPPGSPHPPHPIQLSLSVVERLPADIKKGQQYYQLLIQLVTVYLGIQLQVSFWEEAWERGAWDGGTQAERDY